ncbi:hypothetical protein MNEG_11181 [Monoraphidium neglectum]|uniref:Transmembrane protein 231 n=1 Tax=Monoraphidium neglectum TaxID=145388 RepID=A0A0D2JAL7_9CHLO|nr:hypothetical protein MNEG_11181 [Monoraphidium neglectum]KIY96782.1 hypothetical protein MNEG_11181 [Monoraphidium neglectum]|eukprot:XP_013895802.1 hypothetical protein MNEG_11181 [Monoraphidium neglectum]
MNGAWAVDRGLSRGQTESNARTGLLMLLGTCAAVWVVVTSIAAAGRPNGAVGLVEWPAAPAAPHSPRLEALLALTAVDPARLVVGLNVTLRDAGGAGGAAARAAAPDAGRGQGGATLRLLIGGVSRVLPWPPAAERHAAQQTTAELRQLSAHPRAFDSYSLSLKPLSAVLRSCSGGGGGGDGGSSGGDRHCTSVALPLLLAFDASAVPGYKIAPRLAGGSEGGAQLVVTRATRQRVVRLMAHMLQWLVASYVSAWWAGNMLCHWLLRRLLMRRAHRSVWLHGM